MQSISLQKKLSVTLFILLMLVGVSTWFITQVTISRYSLEFYQRLNMPIAMYMTGEQQFIRQGVVDEQSLKELAHHVMVVNPSLEIYLLDDAGHILSHALPDESVLMKKVSLEPIQDFLQGDNQALLLGDDPRTPYKSNIFSAHPIIEDEQLQGYLYAVLAGNNFQTLLNDVRGSHALFAAATVLVLCLVIALVSGMTAFYFLTQRLTKLTYAVNAIDVDKPGQWGNIKLPQTKHSDEIDFLIQAFESLLDKNRQQYQLLDEADSNRRELIANVSHDLRTPLTSMQGYIETLLIKGSDLSDEKIQEFLSVAHKQSKHLGNLVADLFELAKLDNNKVAPVLENFSLIELIYDVVQDFELQVEKKHIHIDIQVASDHVMINGDIRMIQRVFENLLSNAIRYTPQQGGISVIVAAESDQKVAVSVANDGKVISATEREYIFKRYYRAHNPEEDKSEHFHHSGIGLAIVEKILQLHQCHIKLCEKKQNGAEFIFELPIQHQASIII